MATFDVMVKRTHKFTVQVQAADITAAAALAKQMVKDGVAGAVEYDLKFNVFAVLLDPDTIPPVP